MLIFNGLTEEQWAFARAVAGEVARSDADKKRYREALEEIAEGTSNAMSPRSAHLIASEALFPLRDPSRDRYLEALERIASYDDDKYECYASTLARIAREALEG